MKELFDPSFHCHPSVHVHQFDFSCSFLHVCLNEKERRRRRRRRKETYVPDVDAVVGDVVLGGGAVPGDVWRAARWGGRA